MSCGHKIVKCRCGNVISQCRCWTVDKQIEILSSCERCAKNTVHVSETLQQQRERIGKAIAGEIDSLKGKGVSFQLLGLRLMNWLIDARIRIEELERGKSPAVKPNTCATCYNGNPEYACTCQS